MGATLSSSFFRMRVGHVAYPGADRLLNHATVDTGPAARKDPHNVVSLPSSKGDYDI